MIRAEGFTGGRAWGDTLRLAHLRGDMLHLLAPSAEGWCYQLGDGVHLTRRQGRKQWSMTINS